MKAAVVVVALDNVWVPNEIQNTRGHTETLGCHHVAGSVLECETAQMLRSQGSMSTT